MATAILTENQQAAVLVSFPQTQRVSQDSLARIAALRRQAETIDAELKAAEAKVRAALEVGAPVEAGLLSARLKVTERRSVAWKAVCERELGEAYCTRVLAATRPDTYVSLVVEA